MKVSDIFLFYSVSYTFYMRNSYEGGRTWSISLEDIYFTL